MHRALSAAWSSIERFAHARGAVPATMLWSLAQGSVVPGPAELLLLPLALADPARAWGLALAAATGSILGGCVAYWIGAAAFLALGKPLLAMIGVSDATLASAMTLLARHGAWFVLGSTLTPLSTKAVSIGAGAVGVPFPVFALALGLGRSIRFSVVALLARAGGGALHRWRTRLLKR
jgi:membrane protein YqaA with SNARE-associated domain